MSSAAVFLALVQYPHPHLFRGAHIYQLVPLSQPAAFSFSFVVMNQECFLHDAALSLLRHPTSFTEKRRANDSTLVLLWWASHVKYYKFYLKKKNMKKLLDKLGLSLGTGYSHLCHLLTFFSHFRPICRLLWWGA